jgi:hypothetical protein
MRLFKRLALRPTARVLRLLIQVPEMQPHAARRCCIEPSRSAASVSSQPPTQAPSTKTCGTVLMPLTLENDD